MSTVRPHMHGLSYILGFPTQDEMKLKMDKIAKEKNITPDNAWIGLVYSIVQELQDEDSEASLSSILTLLMERPVIAPKLYLITYDIQTDGVTRQHPMICFQMRNVMTDGPEKFLEIDKALADHLSQIFQTTFECDFVETVFVQ